MIRFLNYLAGTVSIFLMLEMLCMAVPPVAEERAFYSFIPAKQIGVVTGQNSGTMGCVQNRDRGSWYAVSIAVESPLLKNSVVKHENCHIRQYKEEREPNELECYARMFLP